MVDDERAVLLGTVQERQAVDDRAPTACKAGGTPVRTFLSSRSHTFLLEAN